MWIANHEQEQADLLGDGEGNANDDDYDKGDIESTPSGDRVVGARTRRSKRSKTCSCPAGSMMFSEEETALGPMLKPHMVVGGKAGLLVMGTDTYQDASSHTEGIMSEGVDMAETTPKSHHPPRLPRAERRTISSPKSNMLFEIEMDTIGTQ